MTTNNPIVEHVTGTIVRVNDNGAKLNGGDGWFNISKYADPVPELPEEGDTVRLGLDKSGYIRTITVLDDDELPATPDRAADRRAPAHDQGLAAPPDIMVLTMRQAALDAAVSVLGKDMDVPAAGDVLAMATEFEHWLLRHE